MDAFASAADYRLLYDTDMADERLDALLLKASRKIARQLEDAGIAVDEDDEEYMAVLSDVCIDVTHRAVGTDADVPFGANQFGETTGSVTWNFSLANPYGDMFLTAENRRDLGLNKSRGRMLHPACGRREPWFPTDETQ